MMKIEPTTRVIRQGKHEDDFKLMHVDKIIVDGVAYTNMITIPNKKRMEMSTLFVNGGDCLCIKQPYYNIDKEIRK